MITLEERFYVGERGFYFTVQTGLGMTNVGAGDVRSVLRRPNGSVVRRPIPISDVVDHAAGTVLVPIGEGDLAAAGMYSMQVWVRDGDRERPSHPFRFEVSEALMMPAGVFQ